MHTKQKLLHDAAIEVSISDSPDGLADINHPSVAAVIWRRQLVPDFQDWIDRLDPSALPCARLILQPRAVRDAVGAICDGSGLPDGPERCGLINDIAALSDVFAGQMSAPHLQLRLDVIATNACSEFPIDAATAQLIFTDRITGTTIDAADPASGETVLQNTTLPSAPSVTSDDGYRRSAAYACP